MSEYLAKLSAQTMLPLAATAWMVWRQVFSDKEGVLTNFVSSICRRCELRCISTLVSLAPGS